MSVASALLRVRYRLLRTAIRQASWAQLAVAGCFVALGAALFAAVYLFFHRGFGFLLADALAGPLMVRYAFEASFALVFFLGVVSFVVTSFSMLFRDDEVRMLAPMPVEPREIFAHRFWLASFASSWPVLLLALPSMLALGARLDAAPSYYVFCAAMALLFTQAISVAGALLSFVVAPAARRVRSGLLRLVELFIFGAGAVWLIRTVVPRSIFRLFDVSTAYQAAEAGKTLQEMFGGLPSHPFAAVASSVVPFDGGWGPGALIMGIAAAIGIGVFLLVVFADRSYTRIWQSYAESGFIAGPADAVPPRKRRPFPRLFRWGHSFLFEKDLLTLARDDEELSRAGFLLLLLALYVMAMRSVSLMEAFSRTDLFAWVVAFGFAAIGYFALTFAMRFVFPAMSLEGKSAWVLWSSPVHPHEVFSWKFFFWAVTITAVMEAAAVAFVTLFGMPSGLAVMILAGVAMVSVSLVALALAIGSVCPCFGVRDPDAIATTPAGLATTAGGLVYLWIMSRYVHRLTLAYLDAGSLDVLGLFGMLIVTLAVIAVSWATAMRLSDRLEILT